jgi:SAM-dependent methyltransferase
MANTLANSAYANREPSFYESYLSRFTPMQPPLLDLGCGFGLLLALAGEHGIDAIGVELVEDRVTDCRARGLDVRRHDLAEPLPFPDISFGMVYSGQVIEHVPEPVKLTLFAEALRVLRPGGQFQVRSPCRHYEPARQPGHDHLITPSELHALLRQAGWQDIMSLDYPQQVPEIPRDVVLDLWERYHPDLLSQSASAICTKR